MELEKGFYIVTTEILKKITRTEKNKNLYNIQGKCPLCYLKIELGQNIYLIEQDSVESAVHAHCLEDLTAVERGIKALENAEKITWVSKHSPLPAQIKALKERFGGIANIIRINKTFENYTEVLDRIIETGAKYAVVVLPLSMTQLLVNAPKAKGITWVEAEMESVHEERLLNEGSCNKHNCKDFNPETDTVIQASKVSRHLRFVRFNKILWIETVKEPF